MRALCFGVVAVTLIASPAIGQENPAVAVVKKAIDAHGGADLLNKYKAGEYQVKGTIGLPFGDTDFTGEVVYQLPDQYRMTLNLDVKSAKIALVQIANGKNAKTTVNGETQKIPEAQKNEALQAAAMQEMTQLTPLLNDKKYKLKAEKDAEVGSNPAAVVVVTSEGLKDVTLFFDKKSGLLVKTSRKGLNPEGKDVVEDSVLTDYKKTDGVQIPMTMTVTHDGKKFMSITVTGAKMLEKVADPKVFAVE